MIEHAAFWFGENFMRVGTVRANGDPNVKYYSRTFLEHATEEELIARAERDYPELSPEQRAELVAFALSMMVIRKDTKHEDDTTG